MRAADFTRSFPATTALLWFVQWIYSAAAIAATSASGNVRYQDNIRTRFQPWRAG